MIGSFVVHANGEGPNVEQTYLERAWAHVSKVSAATWITLIGLYFYSAKANDYELFYNKLNVDLNDVGLNYTTVLARSRQEIITPLLLLAVSLYSVQRSLKSIASAEWSVGRAHTGRWLRLRQGKALAKPICWLLVSIVCAVAFLGYAYSSYQGERSIANSAANVIRGDSLRAVKTESGYTVLNVQVRRAWVESVAPNAPASLKDLTGRTILYLGQADGTLVLYDPTNIATIYVPRSLVVLGVEAEP